MRRLLSCTKGAGMLEFALFAPMVALGLLVMTDIGIAIGTRMELDRNVRAGAQAAMSLNNNPDSIAGIVRTSSTAPITVNVTEVCACGGAATVCTAQCASGDPPSNFFEIRATRQQDGLILGTRTIRSETRVQIR
jgi:Flp pilus assembly protein TadG